MREGYVQTKCARRTKSGVAVRMALWPSDSCGTPNQIDDQSIKECWGHKREKTRTLIPTFYHLAYANLCLKWHSTRRQVMRKL